MVVALAVIMMIITITDLFSSAYHAAQRVEQYKYKSICMHVHPNNDCYQFTYKEHNNNNNNSVGVWVCVWVCVLSLIHI